MEVCLTSLNDGTNSVVFSMDFLISSTLRAMYAAILTTMGAVVLAVTTNLNINFLRKPEPRRDLLGESWLMKVGKRLIVGEVIIYSQDDPEPVAHATCTYSIPPQSIQTKVQS